MISGVLDIRWNGLSGGTEGTVMAKGRVLILHLALPHQVSLRMGWGRVCTALGTWSLVCWV